MSVSGSGLRRDCGSVQAEKEFACLVVPVARRQVNRRKRRVGRRVWPEERLEAQAGERATGGVGKAEMAVTLQIVPCRRIGYGGQVEPATICSDWAVVPKG